MDNPLHPHVALIDAVGPHVVRAHFRQTSQGLYAWRKRGVPYAQRGAFAQLAGVHGVSIPVDFFAPPRRTRTVEGASL